MENKNICLNTSDLLINTGWLLTLLRFVNIIDLSWLAIFKYWLVIVLIFAAELAIIVVLGGIKWLIKKVAK